MSTTIIVKLGDRSYPIHVGAGVWEAVTEYLAGRSPAKITLVTDERVGSLYGEAMRTILREADLDHLYVTFPQGEKSKSFHQLERLCREMALAGVDREGLVLALGGGVVGDLAGMAASTYMRGIRLIQLPTTLLAMVDSSVGGKTGINIPEGKNLVGTFYQPEGVFADSRVLDTLDERDWYSGLAEVLKIALTMDEDLFAYLEGLADLGPDRGLDVARVVSTACMRKADVVRQDEREAGLRRVLNFGHSLGHAVEAALGYGKVRHGEAVVMGMQAALRLSVDICDLSQEHYDRATSVLRRIPVPALGSVSGELEAFLRRDKKSASGSIQVVLLSSIGHYEFVSLKDPVKLVEALRKSEEGE